MGLTDRIRAAVERVVASAETRPEDGRLTWPDDVPVAFLVESERDPGASPSTEAYLGRDLVEWPLGVRYRFVMEVRRPGVPPYRLERVTRVPARVEGKVLMPDAPVPRGATVPLVVTGPADEDVEVDWDRYLAHPGVRRQTQRLAAESQWDAVGARFERSTKPDQVARIRENSRTAVHSWAALVQAGRMTRAEFDRNAEQLLRMGHLLPQDHAAAIAAIDG